jgi:hypothetical protein
LASGGIVKDHTRTKEIAEIADIARHRRDRKTKPRIIRTGEKRVSVKTALLSRDQEAAARREAVARIKEIADIARHPTPAGQDRPDLGARHRRDRKTKPRIIRTGEKRVSVKTALLSRDQEAAARREAGALRTAFRTTSTPR